MTNKLPSLQTITQARITAETHFNRLQVTEHLLELLPLGKRLATHHRLLTKHDLVLAIEVPTDANARFPGLYILKRDHSRWCKIWRCGSDGGFRLDADERGWRDDSGHWHSSYELMQRDLTADLDLAEQCIVHLLERDEIRYGNSYLPATLHDINTVTLPELAIAPASVLALPSPECQSVAVRSIEAVAVEVPLPDKPPPAPAREAPRLRAVPLAPPPPPARRWPWSS